jgi:putative ABC transport system substrate-binding protein
VRHGKRIELLKEAIPSATRLAVLDPIQDRNQREGLQRFTKTQRVELDFVNVSRFEDFQAAFAKIAAMHPDALLTLRQFLTISRRKQIADFALKEKLPSVFEGRDFVQAGGLLSYGANNRAAWRRAATFVDKILKGANPANLPVETPPLELVINLATAKKLGITIAPELLLEADEVIR